MQRLGLTAAFGQLCAGLDSLHSKLAAALLAQFRLQLLALLLRRVQLLLVLLQLLLQLAQLAEGENNNRLTRNAIHEKGKCTHLL